MEKGSSRKEVGVWGGGGIIDSRVMEMKKDDKKSRKGRQKDIRVRRGRGQLRREEEGRMDKEEERKSQRKRFGRRRGRGGERMREEVGRGSD